MSGVSGIAEGTRRERKEHTRRRILEAGLRLSDEGGLSAVSLRHVAREVGIVPTAFYRHFASVEELGLALVDDAFVSLRSMLRDVRRSAVITEMVPRSIDVVEEHVGRRPDHFAFIFRERLAGPRAVRAAIRHELEHCQHELATDIARVPGTESWSVADLDLLAGVLVTAVVSTTDELLNAPASSRRAIKDRARKQLLMVVVGAQHWESRDQS